jgi:Acyl-CoA synthetases (AMP-forming)/AMP-acid ligases II
VRPRLRPDRGALHLRGAERAGGTGRGVPPRRPRPRKGDRVALLAHNRVEYVDLLFAAAKTGLVLVPLGTRLTPHELAFIVRNADVSALLYGGDYAETVGALRAEADVPRRIALDSPSAPGDLCLAAELAARTDEPFERTRCDGEDLHLLLYTSGTTEGRRG